MLGRELSAPFKEINGRSTSQKNLVLWCIKIISSSTRLKSLQKCTIYGRQVFLMLNLIPKKNFFFKTAVECLEMFHRTWKPGCPGKAWLLTVKILTFLYYSFHFGIETQMEDNFFFSKENTHLFSNVACCSFPPIHTETSSMSCNSSSEQN